MKDKESAKKEIEKLINNFSEREEELLKKTYKEHRVRKEFIDKFFNALGWDTFYEQNISAEDQDVIEEDSVTVDGRLKEPDYAFKTGRTKRFFVEAKAPHKKLYKDISPALQVRRYGLNARLPISILTDFEELAIYDTTIAPKKTDKPNIARLYYWKYREFLDQFDVIYDLLSKEALYNPESLYYSIVKKTAKKNNQTIDEIFLKYLDKCRVDLSKNIANRNKEKNLSETDFNYAIIKILDRIIFLRIAEDRDIEPEDQLLKLVDQENIYKNLTKLFNKCVSRFNSSLFEEDKFLEKLTIDDKVLKDIIKGLYYPNPYDFRIMPIEIIGSIYERFLGQIIRRLPSGGVKVEVKPEIPKQIKKHLGAFYTPEYVINYIVENTIKPKLADCTTIEEVSNIKVLDPSCGSGSFLIGAYDFLLDWHLDYYTQNKKRISEALKKGKIYLYKKINNKDFYRLTIVEKRRILLNNIHGVDLDEQAVEVAKLSLALKMLEGENDETVGFLFKKTDEGVLPDLSLNNIKRGNTLIESDINGLFTDIDHHKIYPFNWDAQGVHDKESNKILGRGFPEIMANGGFDIIIGNPPWGALLSETELDYLRDKHKAIIVRMIDSYMYFIHRSLKLLNNNGYWGMILPDSLLYQTDTIKLRKFILDNFQMVRLINTGNVFKGVTRPTAIVIVTNRVGENLKIKDIANTAKETKETFLFDESEAKIDQKKYYNIPYLAFNTGNIDKYDILNNINKLNIKPLNYFVDGKISRGASPDYKDAFIVNSDTVNKNHLESSKVKPVLTGGTNIKRYNVMYNGLYLLYMTRYDNYRNYPNICNFINSFKAKITCTEVKTKKHSIYSLHRAREEDLYLRQNKIVGVITEDEIVVAIDREQYYITDGAYMFTLKDHSLTEYIVGILNSNLFVFLYRLIALEAGRVLAQVKPAILDTLPIVLPEKESEIFKNICEHVKKIEDFNKQLKVTNTQNQRATIVTQINYYKDEINKSVYKTYKIKAEEIDIIEKSIN